MSTSRINQKIERPLTREEIDARMQNMMEDRRNQDIKAREKFGAQEGKVPERIMPIIEKPLTRDEINERMQQMMSERREQDSAIRKANNMVKM